MPTEQNTTWVGGAPLWVSDDTSSSTVSQPTSPVADQISDLGDILLEKNMDDVQSNDFMPVWQNDVAQLDSINNISETQIENSDVSLDSSVTTSDTTTVAEETSSQNGDTNTIDLGDINLSWSTASSTDVINTNTVSTTLENNTDSNQTENTENTTTDEAVVEPIIDLPEISMDSINLDDNAEVTTENNISNETNISENTQSDANQQTTEVSEVTNSNTTDIWWISLDSIELPSSPVSTEESMTNEPQGDNNISLEDGALIETEAATNESTETSTDTTTESIDFDALENIDLPESSSVDINGGDGNPSTENTTTDEAVVEPIVDLPEISLDSIKTPVVSEVAVEETQNEEQPIVDVSVSEEIQPEAENTEKVSESMANEEFMVNEVPIVEAPILEESISENNSIDISNIETPIIDTPIITENTNTPESTLEVAQQNVENSSTEAVIELPNIDDKLANIAQIAEKVEEGIDLDSLVWPDEQKDNSEDSINNNTVIAPQQDVVPPVVQNDTTTTQDKKPLKMALVGMGIVAILGAGYFWYKTVFPMGLGNSETSSVLSWDMLPDLYSGDSMSGDTLSGDIWQNSGEILLDDILSGSTNSGDTDIWVLPDDGTDSNWNTDGQTPTRTLDDVKNDTDILISKARKLLIKATIAKNGPARISAFSIQKDVDSFVQTLANTTDITTLEASEKTLEQLSQRLTSLENRLNGSSN